MIQLLLHCCNPSKNADHVSEAAFNALKKRDRGRLYVMCELFDRFGNFILKLILNFAGEN